MVSCSSEIPRTNLTLVWRSMHTYNSISSIHLSSLKARSTLEIVLSHRKKCLTDTLSHCGWFICSRFYCLSKRNYSQFNILKGCKTTKHYLENINVNPPHYILQNDIFIIL